MPDKGYGMRKCKVFGKKILPDFKERIKRIIMNWILINGLQGDERNERVEIILSKPDRARPWMNEYSALHLHLFFILLSKKVRLQTLQSMQTTHQTAPYGDGDTTAKDWKTLLADWCLQARKAFENGYNVHDDKTPLLALRKEWIWWLLDWCDTWPFEKYGECIHSTSRSFILFVITSLWSVRSLRSVATKRIKKV